MCRAALALALFGLVFAVLGTAAARPLTAAAAPTYTARRSLLQGEHDCTSSPRMLHCRLHAAREQEEALLAVNFLVSCGAGPLRINAPQGSL